MKNKYSKNYNTYYLQKENKKKKVEIIVQSKAYLRDLLSHWSNSYPQNNFSNQTTIKNLYYLHLGISTMMSLSIMLEFPSLLDASTLF